MTSNKKNVAPRRRGQCHHKRRRLVPQDNLESAPVKRNDALKYLFGLTVKPSLFMFRLMAQ